MAFRISIICFSSLLSVLFSFVSGLGFGEANKLDVVCDVIVASCIG